MRAELEAAARRRSPETVPPFDLIVGRQQRRRRARRVLGVAAVSAATAATIVGVGLTLGGTDPSPVTVAPMTTPSPVPSPDRSAAGPVEVRGSMTMTGGPQGASPAGVAGDVVFTGGNGDRRRARAADDGSFTIALPPGRYTVTGTSPRYQDGAGLCVAEKPVVVTAGGSPTVRVLCVRR